MRFQMLLKKIKAEEEERFLRQKEEHERTEELRKEAEEQKKIEEEKEREIKYFLSQNILMVLLLREKN